MLYFLNKVVFNLEIIDFTYDNNSNWVFKKIKKIYKTFIKYSQLCIIVLEANIRVIGTILSVIRSPK